jgi:hypothetical protein
MSRAPIFRLALAAVLLLALTAPPAVAAASLGHSSPPGLVDTLWQWLHALWAADGVMIDPAGTKIVGIGHAAPTTVKVGVGKAGPRQR